MPPPKAETLPFSVSRLNVSNPPPVKFAAPPLVVALLLDIMLSLMTSARVALEFKAPPVVLARLLLKLLVLIVRELDEFTAPPDDDAELLVNVSLVNVSVLLLEMAPPVVLDAELFT